MTLLHTRRKAISPKFFVRRGGGCGVGKEMTDEMFIVAGYFIGFRHTLATHMCVRKMAKERAEQVIILGLSYETETG